MFQGKGFLILLVIAAVALKQFEAKPHPLLPKFLTKDVDVEIKKPDIKTPLKIAGAVKTAALLKGAVLVKGAALVKGVKTAAIVKKATELKVKKPIKIIDEVKDKIDEIIKPSSKLSFEASKPLFGLF